MQWRLENLKGRARREIGENMEGKKVKYLFLIIHHIKAYGGAEV
jgi:hypothetical protein